MRFTRMRLNYWSFYNFIMNLQRAFQIHEERIINTLFLEKSETTEQKAWIDVLQNWTLLLCQLRHKWVEGHNVGISKWKFFHFVLRAYVLLHQIKLVVFVSHTVHSILYLWEGSMFIGTYSVENKDKQIRVEYQMGIDWQECIASKRIDFEVQ